MIEQDIPASRAYRLLHPKLVTVIGTAHGGKVNLMPASWVMPASFEPPLLVAAVGLERYTLRLIKESGAFTVNPVGPDMAAAVAKLGSISGADVDKARLVGVLHSSVGAPCLRGALACIECIVAGMHRAGDHVLVLGEIRRARVFSQCFDPEKWVYREKCWPVYHAGGRLYARLGGYFEV